MSAEYSGSPGHWALSSRLSDQKQKASDERMCRTGKLEVGGVSRA